jgi:hypothetical protein
VFENKRYEKGKNDISSNDAIGKETASDPQNEGSGSFWTNGTSEGIVI